MIERMARVLAYRDSMRQSRMAGSPWPEGPSDPMMGDSWKGVVKDVYDILAAMREPTETMERAALRASVAAGQNVCMDDLNANYRTMIDAALKEAP